MAKEITADLAAEADQNLNARSTLFVTYALLIQVFTFATLIFSAPASFGQESCAQIFSEEVVPRSAFHQMLYDDLQERTMSFDRSLGRIFPNYRESLRDAERTNSPIFNTYKRLGFNWDENGDLVGPSMRDLVAETNKEYDRQGTPQNYRLTPAWPFGQVVPKDGYNFVEYITKPYDAPYFEILSPHDRQVPGRMFSQAIADGYILIDKANTHDFGHLASFLTYPKYAKAMIDGFKMHVKLGPSKARNNRLFYFFEDLELPHEVPKSQLQMILHYPSFSEAKTDMNLVKAYFNSLDRSVLFTYAEKFAKSYEKLFTGYGGASGQIPERFNAMDGFPNGGGSRDVLASEWHRTPRPYVQGITPEEGINYMGRHLQILLDFRGKAETTQVRDYLMDPDFNEKKLESFIREYVARMEYAVWEGAKFDVAQVISYTIQYDHSEVPYTEYIREVRGDFSRTYRSLNAR